MNSILVARYIGSVLDPILFVLAYFIAKFLISKKYPIAGAVSSTLIVVTLIGETISAKVPEQKWGDDLLFHAITATIQTVIVVSIIILLSKRRSKSNDVEK